MVLEVLLAERNARCGHKGHIKMLERLYLVCSASPSSKLVMTGDTQALAPATEEQAADAAAPETGAEGAAEDDAMAEDAWNEEPLPDEQSGPTEEQVSSAACSSCIACYGPNNVRPHHDGLVTKGVLFDCVTPIGKLHARVS